MGAPTGNVNAVKHGARSKRAGIVLAKLGDGLEQAYMDASKLRQAIEAEVSQKRGSLSILDRAKIQTICRLELSARASEMAIRKDSKMLGDQLRLQREAIVKWTLQRDKLMGELLGDVAGSGSGDGDDDPWAVVDQAAAERTRAAQKASGTADGTSSDQDNSNATGDVPGGSNVESETADVASGDQSGQPPAVSGHVPGSGNLDGGVV